MTLLDINLWIAISGAARSSEWDLSRWTVHHARNMKKEKKKGKKKGTLGSTVDLVCVIMRLGLLQSHVAHPPGMIVHEPGVGCYQKFVEHWSVG